MVFTPNLIPGWGKKFPDGKFPSMEYVHLNLETVIQWVFINRTWIFRIHTGFSENHLNVSCDGNVNSNLEKIFPDSISISGMVFRKPQYEY